MLGNEFELLVRDLQTMREKRRNPAPAPHQERPSAPSRPAVTSRQVMSKALSPPRPAQRWNAVRQAQTRLTKSMHSVPTVTPADRARDLFRVLDLAAKAGRLSAVAAAKVDALRHRSGLYA